MFPHEYGSFKIDLLIAGVYGFLYLGWNEVCHSINGFWTCVRGREVGTHEMLGREWRGEIWK